MIHFGFIHSLLFSLFPLFHTSNMTDTVSAKNINQITIENCVLHSEYLERDVTIDFYVPSKNFVPEQTHLLFINDGQDLPKMPFSDILNSLLNANKIKPLLCVGIYCGEERMREYGTAYSADFKQRGDKAGLYTKFILEELMPFIRKKYNAPSFKDKSFAGFSLGGLSALDIAWNHASEFTNIGLFSGSLWWRRKAYDSGYNEETDKLMHLQIRKGVFAPWLKFFIECGTNDEKEDRNKNGIIDSIDDALDLIMELKLKGYTNQHINYHEIPEGKHDVPTWAKAFPSFLEWCFGK
jgi:enterochelin esterase-like enzyme